MAKLKAEVALLKKENMTLKARARTDFTQSGGGGQQGSYNRGGGRGARGGRGGASGSGSGSGRTYSNMNLADKKAATCAAWNRAQTPGGSGGCTNVETNGHCSQNGVSLKHACSVVKPGNTHICWDRRHTALGH